MTAHHWRALRLKLILAGVTDPMRLPSMHLLLDNTEAAVLESMAGDKDSEARRSMFLNKLYAPTPEVRNINGDTYVAQPAGFEPDQVEADFDAFAKAVTAE